MTYGQPNDPYRRAPGPFPPPAGHGQRPRDPRDGPGPRDPHPQATPPRARNTPPSTPRSRPRWGCIIPILVVFIAFVAWLVDVFAFSSGGSFTAKVSGTTVVNPATLAVAITVTNTGTSPATPDCTVDATDPSGAYSGVNEGSFATAIPAGQANTAVIDVTIASQGAQYVTDTTVTCR